MIVRFDSIGVLVKVEIIPVELDSRIKSGRKDENESYSKPRLYGGAAF
jgi:hypothetical protein